MLNNIFQIIVLIATGLIAGSTFYISLVEIYVRSLTSEKEQLKNWKMVFPKASGILKTFGVITGVFILLTGYFTNNLLWYISAIPLFILVPFTAIYIHKMNNELAVLEDYHDVIPKIQKWDKLHHIRTVLAISAFIICVIASVV